MLFRAASSLAPDSSDWPPGRWRWPTPAATSSLIGRSSMACETRSSEERSAFPAGQAIGSRRQRILVSHRTFASTSPADFSHVSPAMSGYDAYKGAIAELFNATSSRHDSIGGLFAHFGSRLVEWSGMQPGDRVLDVAAGTGQSVI